MKKKQDIPGRVKKLEDELRTLRAGMAQEREDRLSRLPEPLEVLVGQVDDNLVALPIPSIREVLPRVFLETMPESPAYLAGFLNWRGNPVPVIDPSARWGNPAMPIRLEDRIVIFMQGERLYGMLMSHVEQITRVPRSELGTIPPEIPAAPYALAMWYAAGRNVLLMQPEHLIDSAELALYETAR